MRHKLCTLYKVKLGSITDYVVIPVVDRPLSVAEAMPILAQAITDKVGRTSSSDIASSIDAVEIVTHMSCCVVEPSPDAKEGA